VCVENGRTYKCGSVCRVITCIAATGNILALTGVAEFKVYNMKGDVHAYQCDQLQEKTMKRIRTQIDVCMYVCTGPDDAWTRLYPV